MDWKKVKEFMTNEAFFNKMEEYDFHG